MGLLKGAARLAIAGVVARKITASRRNSTANDAAARDSRSNEAMTSTRRVREEREHEREEIPAQRAGEPGPDTPAELESSDWKATAKRALKEVKEDRVTLVAAGMTYYTFLAVFPAIIAFVGILGLVNVSPDTIKDMERSIAGAVPSKEVADLLVEPMRRAENAPQGASLVATLLGIGVALWSASSGMVALQKGLNVAYDVPEERKFVKARLVAFALLAAVLLLGGVPSPLFAFGDDWYWKGLGWVLTGIAVIILFSLFYYLGPNREKPSWTWVSPGGLIGAILWILASIAFGVYVNNFANYGKTYGSLAGVVILLLWLYISALAVLLGGELNAETERQAEQRRTGDR